VLKEIAETKELTEETTAKLDGILKEFTETFKVPAGA
jgi:hypothetical protein